MRRADSASRHPARGSRIPSSTALPIFNNLTRARYPGAVYRALVLAACTVALYAQTASVTGVIQGSVSDTSGATIPGVRVTVRQQETGTERRAETAPDGRFAITNLAPGTYTLNLDASGFVPVQVKPFP